jgi:uncharacterized protein
MSRNENGMGAFNDLVTKLALQPHPEGGFYREVFRSTERVTTSRGMQRSAMTSIYYLLPGTTFSTWHRLTADESWHFYQGSSLTLVIIKPEGSLLQRSIGPDGPWQITVPAASHFAAYVDDTHGYALVGCTVAPGFEFADFHLAGRAVLTAAYPQHAELIARYSR